jgi:UDP:flavonoid glycosyltransferase YjiC (YdhE family)
MVLYSRLRGDGQSVMYGQLAAVAGALRREEGWLMRMLFCFAGGPGHFHPMVPVIQAAEIAGHTVAVAGGPSRVTAVQAGGFTAFGVGPPRKRNPARRLPLQEVDVAREERDLRERLVGRSAARARDLRALATDWKPDIVVADETDFGAVLAAEGLGIPYATVLVLATGSLVRREVVADALEAVRAELGLPPDPDFVAMSRYLVLSSFPPILRDPACPSPTTTHLFRPMEVEDRPSSSLPWPEGLAGVPTVYFTLGTEFNVESGDLFTRVLAGLRQLRANVLVTVGHEIDPAELGPQPANVHVERFLPQTEVLPRCELVVFHGGSGTLTGALAHGLPMVILAMGADQPANALRCEALGIGISLDPVRVTPNEVRDAAASVLEDPAYRRVARRLRQDIAAQPEPMTAVGLLERVVADRAPPGNG